ncbi:hypothetical protein QUF80_12090 [Desulfococcaceae bacterium HSG8]|nr:hypothetical protein [Desulfococcaceae bacterium HSG8]
MIFISSAGTDQPACFLSDGDNKIGIEEAVHILQNQMRRGLRKPERRELLPEND